MKYIDCLKVVALYLDDASLSDYLDENKVPTLETERKIKQLCSFVDIIANEICCEYFPIVKIEKVQSENNRIEYEKLSEYVVDIRWVKKDGKKINYDLFSIAISVDSDCEYEVCYEYAPKEFSGDINAEIPLYGRITSRIVGIGAVAEYCLANDRFDEAIAYDKMFKDALVGVEKSRGKLRMKQRRWA